MHAASGVHDRWALPVAKMDVNRVQCRLKNEGIAMSFVYTNHLADYMQTHISEKSWLLCRYQQALIFIMYLLEVRFILQLDVMSPSPVIGRRNTRGSGKTRSQKDTCPQRFSQARRRSPSPSTRWNQHHQDDPTELPPATITCAGIWHSPTLSIRVKRICQPVLCWMKIRCTPNKRVSKWTNKYTCNSDRW